MTLLIEFILVIGIVYVENNYCLVINLARRAINHKRRGEKQTQKEAQLE
jgi:hypothetical protein